MAQGGMTYFFFLLARTFSFPLFILCHGVILLLWGALFLKRNFHSRNAVFPLISLIMTTFMGVMGSLIGFLICLLIVPFRSVPEPFKSKAFLIQGAAQAFDEEPSLLAVLNEKDLQTKTTVVPFKDILTGGTLEDKAEAVTKINYHYKSSFARVLFLAKRDDKHSIRVLAASTLSRLNQKYLRRHRKLLSQAQKASASAWHFLSLAHHLRRYAACGFLDKNRAHYLRQESIAWYQKYLTLYPNDLKVLKILARLYAANNQLQKALEVFQVLQKQNIPLTLKQRLCYLSVLYDMGSYDQVRKTIGTMEADQKQFFGSENGFLSKGLLEPWVKGFLKEEASV